MPFAQPSRLASRRRGLPDSSAYLNQMSARPLLRKPSAELSAFGEARKVVRKLATDNGGRWRHVQVRQFWIGQEVGLPQG